MKIINKTHWRTDHLRAFIARLAKDELEPAARKALVVTIKYNRQKDKGWCSGRARVGSARMGKAIMTIMLPSQAVDKIDLAHVIRHELAHTRGMEHRQMTKNSLYSRVGNWREIHAWAEEMPLERQAKKPKDDVQLQRYQRALAAEKRWTTKLKRAQTALKNLRPKLRRYEGILTAAGKLPDKNER
jgi:hypothetical protein